MRIKTSLEVGLKRRFQYVQHEACGNLEGVEALTASGYDVTYHEKGRLEQNKKMLLINFGEGLVLALKEHNGQMVAICDGAFKVGLSMHCRAIHGNEEGGFSEFFKLMQYDCLAVINGTVPMYNKDKRKKTQKISDTRAFVSISDARSSCTVGPYKLHLFKDGSLDIRTSELRVDDPEYLHVQIVRNGQEVSIFGGRGRFVTSHSCYVCSPRSVATRSFDMVVG